MSISSWSSRGLSATAALLIAVGSVALPAVAATATASAAGESAVYSWGENGSGQLGDGTVAAHLLPAGVTGVAEAVQLAGGDAHSLALRANGDVLAWGANAQGQLGDSTTTARKVPTAVFGLAGATSIAAGGNFSLAVRDGQIWSWGANASGQLGIGTQVASKLAGPVSSLSNVVGIAAGEAHALAVLADGTVYAWGDNGSGQIGDGTTTARTSPVQVPGVTDVIAVGAGSTHSIALRRDGTILAWGANASGQLGDGSGTARKSPVVVTGIDNAVAIATGELHNLALLSDGNVKAWGHNAFGQIGDGTTNVTRTGTTVLGLSGVTRIAAGDYYSLATAAGGNLYSWGSNTAGQLGTGDRTSRKIATTVSGLSGIGAMAGGTSHTLTAANVPVSVQPNAWWRADANANDAIGSNTATLGAGVSYANGKLRCAWNFTTPRASVELPDSPTLEPGASFTFSSWVNPRDISGTHVIAAKSDAAKSAWSLKLVDGKLVFTASANGTTATTVATSAAVLGVNSWQNVTVVYDGIRASNPDRARLYVDGFAVALTAPSSTTPTSLVDIAATTKLGATPTGDAIDGALDQIRFFRTPLSATQVSDAVTLDANEAGTACDSAAPTVTATIAPDPNKQGWHRAAAKVIASASDDLGGVGVASMTYQVKGATIIPATTVNGNSISVDIYSEGTSDVLVSATDQVGNVSAITAYRVRVDSGVPVITAVPSPAPNQNGWNNSNLVVNFTCSDAISGIASCPVPKTVPGEGSGLGLTGTATDVAGNSASATVSGLKVDRTVPTISGSVLGTPNAAGWFRNDVTVHWTTDDALSGVDPTTVPADTVVKTEGKNISAPAQVFDLAGNGNSARSPQFSIDRTPPTTKFAAPPRYTADTATVTLAPMDNLSGVVATHYTIDGGPVQDGTSFTLETEGDHTVQIWSADAAENVEAPVTVQVLVDRTAPKITHKLYPDANGFGWNNTDVTVTFLCSDKQSGVASCTAPAKVTVEGAGSIVTGTATDIVGNTASDSATVSIDKGMPTIAGSLDRTPGASGWYTDLAFARWECADSLSGVAVCPEVTKIGEGAGKVIEGKVRDLAGNLTTATLGPVNVDFTGPKVVGTPNITGNAYGWAQGDVTVSWTCTDTLSGMAGDCPAPTVVTGEGNNLTATAVAHDIAGNQTVGTAKARIDRTAPVTTAVVPPAGANGSYDHVEVALAATDALSGVEHTYYAVDGGAVVESAGAALVTGAGSHSLRYWSTDRAGNVENELVVAVQLDGMPPTIEGNLEPAANIYGWNNGPTTVHFTCADAESGVVFCGPDAVLSAEGTSAATGTAKDAAGNTATATVPANIDTVKPTIAGRLGVEPNAAGWFNKPVPVSFVCTDALSGVITCPGKAVLSTDGKDLTLTGEAGDKAGNLATAKVAGINLDQVAPVTTATLPAATNGFYGMRAEVTLTATDELSGVAKTFYTVDGGEAREYAGAVVVTGDGKHTVTYFSTDIAGNVESAGKAELTIDGSAPTILAKLSPAANGAGWNNTFPDVQFTCADSGSGVVECGPDAKVTAEGSGQQFTGTAKDAAGNTATAGIEANVDITAPSVSATIAGTKNAAGWYRSPVTVSFTCADELSGIADCAKDVVFSTDGDALTASAEVTDLAGNVGTTKVEGIKLDQVAPVTSAVIPPAGTDGRFGSRTVTLTGADALSGLATTLYAIDGGDTQTYTAPFTVTGGGSHAIRYWSTDVAGNVETASTIEAGIDGVKPTIEGKLVPAANEAGWNNTFPTVAFTCADDASGIVTCGPDVTLTTEGAGQKVTGTAVDGAGNTATADVVANVDITAPSVSGVAVDANGGRAGATGWFRTPVTVSFSCADLLSGVLTCPASVPLAQDGVDLSASAEATDKAGNVGSATVAGIKIDQLAPVTTAVSSTNTPGAVARATVTLTATDATSGVAKTYYSLDGAAARAYDTPVVVTGGNKHTVRYWSVDNAGNEEKALLLELGLDATPPVIVGALSPAANLDGWNNTLPTAKFTCTDDASGVASCGPDTKLTAEGAAQIVTGTAIDGAGNTATAKVTANVDLTAPSVTGVVTSPAYPGSFYRKGMVFTCKDALSGVATCPAAGTLVSNGSTASVTFTVTDRAGNASTSVLNFRTAELATFLNGVLPAETAKVWLTKGGTLTMSIAPDEAGTPRIFYSLDGAKTAISTIPLTAGGLPTVTYSTVVVSRNEIRTTVGVNLDTTAPTIVGAFSPAPNSAGWNKTFPEAQFTCSDGETGAVSCGPNAFLTKEGTAQTVTGTAVDGWGNKASATLTGNVDITPPSVAVTASAGVNSNGWYRTPVSVSFGCADLLSGVATCPATVTLGTEGVNLTATGLASDKAGNTTEGKLTGLNIDRTAPTLRVLGIADGGEYELGKVPTALCEATDALSGVDGGCALSSIGLTIGSVTLTAAATDKAGNTGTATIGFTIVPLKVVLKPTITGVLVPKANYNGWNNTLPEAQFTCANPQSPILTCGPNAKLTREGTTQVVTGKVVDQAGSTATTTVTANVDTTAPAVTAVLTADANAAGSVPTVNGWYRSPVTVSFPCTDATSGINVCPPAVTITQDGANQAVSGTASDRAGNEAVATAKVNLDRVAPVTTAALPPAGLNGWYGKKADVTLKATDAVSGVKQTFYSLDGAAVQVYASPLAITGAGKHTLSYYSTDVAGNVETATSLVVNLDGLAPKITGTLSPLANTAGWNNTYPTAKFLCSDGETGIDTCSPDARFGVEGKGQTAIGTAVDLAGNTASTTVTANVDITAPSVATKTSLTPNTAGWFNAPVTVSFSCADLLSGLASCPAAVVLNKDGVGLSATGTATDKAGNIGTGAVTNIKLDQTDPTLAIGGIVNGTDYEEGKVPAATCTASDALSGLDGACAVSYSESRCGKYLATAAVTDKAGNTTTVTVEYEIVKARTQATGVSGFLGTLNRGGTDFGTVSKVDIQVQNAGSTVPMQFEVFDAKGSTVTLTGTPVAIEPVSSTKAAGPFAAPKATTNAFSLSSKKYQYNWSTTKSMAGQYWRVGVKLPDGSFFTQVVYLK